jgi:hypothetical protein
LGLGLGCHRPLGRSLAEYSPQGPQGGPEGPSRVELTRCRPPRRCTGRGRHLVFVSPCACATGALKWGGPILQNPLLGLQTKPKLVIGAVTKIEELARASPGRRCKDCHVPGASKGPLKSHYQLKSVLNTYLKTPFSDGYQIPIWRHSVMSS